MFEAIKRLIPQRARMRLLLTATVFAAFLASCGSNAPRDYKTGDEIYNAEKTTQRFLAAPKSYQAYLEAILTAKYPNMLPGNYLTMPEALAGTIVIYDGNQKISGSGGIVKYNDGYGLLTAQHVLDLMAPHDGNELAVIRNPNGAVRAYELPMGDYQLVDPLSGPVLQNKNPNDVDYVDHAVIYPIVSGAFYEYVKAETEAGRLKPLDISNNQSAPFNQTIFFTNAARMAFLNGAPTSMQIDPNSKGGKFFGDAAFIGGNQPQDIICEGDSGALVLNNNIEVVGVNSALPQIPGSINAGLPDFVPGSNNQQFRECGTYAQLLSIK